jgi:hypothetical protein
MSVATVQASIQTAIAEGRSRRGNAQITSEELETIFAVAEEGGVTREEMDLVKPLYLFASRFDDASLIGPNGFYADAQALDDMLFWIVAFDVFPPPPAPEL